MENKKITKTMLYNHFDGVVAKADGELWEKKNKILNKYIDMFMQDHSEVLEKINTRLRLIEKHTKELQHVTGVQFCRWNGLNKVESLDAKREFKQIARALFEHRRFGRSEHLDELISKFDKEVVEIDDKLADLKKLHQEINNVIKNARTAKLAYRDLIALGVNMKDFQPEEAMLPAIVKLSVDPCLISSKGC